MWARPQVPPCIDGDVNFAKSPAADCRGIVQRLNLLTGRLRRAHTGEEIPLRIPPCAAMALPLNSRVALRVMLRAASCSARCHYHTHGVAHLHVSVHKCPVSCTIQGVIILCIQFMCACSRLSVWVCGL